MTADLKNNDGFNLYKDLARENENIMISPVSVSAGRVGAYNGAIGRGHGQGIECSGSWLDRLNKNNLALLYYLTSADPELTLNIANSIWILKILNFQPHRGSEKCYQAEAKKLGFLRSSTDVINKWVNDKLGNHQSGVTPPIDSQTIMFLINAVYFKGSWTSPFRNRAHFRTSF